MRKLLLSSLGALILAASATGASAAVVTWTTWDSPSSGSAGTVGVTYAGPAVSLVTNYPTYTPASTFADGTIVENAPQASNNILKVYGGDANVTETLTFSQALVNPVFAIWSLGQGGIDASFDFNQTPTFIAGGPSAEYIGVPIAVSGNSVHGREANGTVQFLGTFTSISWTNPVFEDWYGFNVGYESVAAVPELSTWAMMLVGFAGVGFITYRRRKQSSALFVA